MCVRRTDISLCCTAGRNAHFTRLAVPSTHVLSQGSHARPLNITPFAKCSSKPHSMTSRVDLCALKRPSACFRCYRCSYLLFIRALPEGTWLAQWHYERLKVPHVGNIISETYPRVCYSNDCDGRHLPPVAPHATIQSRRKWFKWLAIRFSTTCRTRPVRLVSQRVSETTKRPPWTSSNRF